MIASAPGKINLALLVAPPDHSGYHPLSSVFEAISLREWVTVRRLGEGEGHRVSTWVYRVPQCEGEPRFDAAATAKFARFDGPDHLALKAARALAPSGVGVQVDVHKTLPVAGGMAGGSADAAAALIAVNDLLDLRLGEAQLEEVGRGLGADVPACLVGGLSLGVGRGDHMSALSPGSDIPGKTSQWWVAAFATEGLSTPKVFGEFDRLGAPGGSGAEIPAIAPWRLEALRDPSTVKEALRNDLTGAATSLRPELSEIGEACVRAGAKTWLLSGSGPTVLALVENQLSGCQVAKHVATHPQVASTTVMWGPALGAQVEDALPRWCSNYSSLASSSLSGPLS